VKKGRHNLMPLIGMGEAPSGDYVTLASFVLSQLHELPKPGDHFVWGSWRFEVVDTDSRRIDIMILVQRQPDEIAARSADPRSNSRRGKSPSQPRDRARQAAHLHDPAGGVVVLGEDARILIYVADQSLLRVGQHQLVLHHRSFEKRDNRLTQRGDVLG
jgi:hypothetical protein